MSDVTDRPARRQVASKPGPQRAPPGGGGGAGGGGTFNIWYGKKTGRDEKELLQSSTRFFSCPLNIPLLLFPAVHCSPAPPACPRSLQPLVPADPRREQSHQRRGPSMTLTSNPRRCDPGRDSGRTMAGSGEGFCVYFAQGRCTEVCAPSDSDLP